MSHDNNAFFVNKDNTALMRYVSRYAGQPSSKVDSEALAELESRNLSSRIIGLDDIVKKFESVSHDVSSSANRKDKVSRQVVKPMRKKKELMKLNLEQHTRENYSGYLLSELRRCDKSWYNFLGKDGRDEMCSKGILVNDLYNVGLKEKMSLR